MANVILLFVAIDSQVVLNSVQDADISFSELHIDEAGFRVI